MDIPSPSSSIVHTPATSEKVDCVAQWTGRYVFIVRGRPHPHVQLFPSFRRLAPVLFAAGRTDVTREGSCVRCNTYVRQISLHLKARTEIHDIVPQKSSRHDEFERYHVPSSRSESGACEKYVSSLMMTAAYATEPAAQFFP